MYYYILIPTFASYCFTMEEIKISVIIPVYNTAPYLYEALDSVLNQTFQNYEVILVNDGSTDNSEAILQEYVRKDKRFLLISQQNKGMSMARNVGMKLARGKYIYFMDSDDILMPLLLQNCYECCEKRGFDFVFFDAETFCDNPAYTMPWDYNRTTNYDEAVLYDGIPLMANMLDHASHRTVVWLMFFRKAHLDNLRLNFYPGILHEDELFTLLLYMQTRRIGCIKKQLVKHRFRFNSIMTKKYSLRNVACYLTVIDELFRFASCHGESERALVNQYAHYTLDKVFYTAHIIPYKDKIAAFRSCAGKGYFPFVSLKTWAVFWLKK